MSNYYRLDNLLAQDADYNILIGERANGKSYAVKELVIKEAIKSKKCIFGLVRRLDSDIKTNLIDSYFADMPIKKLTKGEYDSISTWQRGIFLSNTDEEGHLKRGLKIGYVFALSLDERYKSTEYPDMKYVIYEEFVTRNAYLANNEPRRFMNLCSTIFRRRKGKVFMIANTVSRVCPYFSEWCLRGIPTMQIGQIDRYKFNDINGNDVIIAVEYCANGGTKASGMFFGKAGKQIDGGAWECNEYPHLDTPLNEYEVLYKMSLQHNDFKFNILLIAKDGILSLYIYPAAIKVYDRILTDQHSYTFDTTPCLRKNIKAEVLINYLWLMNKVVYANNLCGDDFNNLIKGMIPNPFTLI